MQIRFGYRTAPAPATRRGRKGKGVVGGRKVNDSRKKGLSRCPRNPKGVRQVSHILHPHTAR